MVNAPAPNIITLVCPFCGGIVRAFFKPEHAVEHTLPTCSKFDTLPIDEFLMATRKKIEQGVQ